MIEGPNNAKIFIGGLSSQTTQETLSAFFSNYGAVVQAQIMMTRDKVTGVERPRGFGFVQFESEETVAAIVGNQFSQRISIDGKDVDVKRIDEERGSLEGRNEIEARKIFVGGLPETVDSAALKAYFANIDPAIQEARVMTDPKSERSRCFGYVTFSTKEFVDRAVASKEGHYMEGKWIDVKPSVPRSGTKGKSREGKGSGKGAGKDAKGKGMKGTKGYGKSSYGGYEQKGYPAYPGYQPYGAYGYPPQPYGYPPPAAYGHPPPSAAGAHGAPTHGAGAYGHAPAGYGAPGAYGGPAAGYGAPAAYTHDQYAGYTQRAAPY